MRLRRCDLPGVAAFALALLPVPALFLVLAF